MNIKRVMNQIAVQKIVTYFLFKIILVDICFIIYFLIKCQFDNFIGIKCHISCKFRLPK